MADDWAPGDLALCIADEWISIGLDVVPDPAPIFGQTYMVSAVRIGSDGERLFLALVGFRPEDDWDAREFVKIEPTGEDILREAKEPIDA